METTDQKDKQLHVRIPRQLYDLIDSSGLTDTAAVTKSLELFFTKDENEQLTSKNEQIDQQKAEINQLKAENDKLKEFIIMKDKHAQDLENMIGFLQGQYIKLNQIVDKFALPAAPEKKWWKFW